MADQSDVTVDSLNVPGRSLVPGVDVGVQDTLEPGETYTIEAQVTADYIPGVGDDDHCNLVGGGVRVEMRVTTGDRSYVRSTECIEGPAGSSGTISVALDAPPESGATETLSVDFLGSGSGTYFADTTTFSIETAADTGEQDGYNVTVNQIETPGYNIQPGRDTGVVETLSPGESYSVAAEIEMLDVPGVGNQDHCNLVGGGAEITMEVSRGAGSVTTTECVSGPVNNTTTLEASLRAPSSGGVTDQLSVDIYGANSGDKLADTTYFEIETSGSGAGEDFTFDISTLETSCDISQTNVTEGDTVTVDVDIEGYLPPEIGSRDIEISLLVDGDVVARGEGGVSVNGARGEEFEITTLPPGDHSIAFELADLGPA